MRKIVLEFWLAVRMFKTQGRRLGTMGWVSLGGLALGVASLVVSMAVVSGFESTLRRHIIDLTGHLQLIQVGGAGGETPEELFKMVREMDPTVKAAIPFVRTDALATFGGKFTGIQLQGFGPECCVVKLDSRVLKGNMGFLQTPEGDQVAIGRGLAQELGLQLNDELKFVLPIVTNSAVDLSSMKFRRKLITARVVAILDLGKHEYNQRMVIAPLVRVQKWAEIGSRVYGILMTSSSDKQALLSSQLLVKKLGPQYRVWDWRDVNSTLFQAVETEKPVLFVVIGLIVLAAAVNVATSLNIHVATKTAQVATLKALGLGEWALTRIFVIQGLMLGMLGCVLGLLLGVLFCGAFSFLEKHFGLIPGDVYKIDRIGVDLRATDLAVIVIATMLICFLAVLNSARRGARLAPAQGLRYE